MQKKVRVNEKYGTWSYSKEVDSECKENIMYYLEGKDTNGTEWNWSTMYYNEILEFIKSDDKQKENYIRYY